MCPLTRFYMHKKGLYPWKSEYLYHILVPSVCLCVCMSVCMSVCKSVCLYICLMIYVYIAQYIPNSELVKSIFHVFPFFVFVVYLVLFCFSICEKRIWNKNVQVRKYHICHTVINIFHNASCRPPARSPYLPRSLPPTSFISRSYLHHEILQYGPWNGK